MVGQQGSRRLGVARECGERHGAVGAHRAEAAHRFKLLGAPICKILSAERRAAGLDGVRYLATVRAVDLLTCGPAVWQGHTPGACHTGGPAGALGRGHEKHEYRRNQPLARRWSFV